jgi:ABC-type branched-subunit amino acid transport system substrate-binding protein/DNA-binding beta-propeller fold protein YncE
MLGHVTARLGPGSTFAGYRIEALAGRGGMGVVYQATDLSLGRPVALKLIAPELADDPRFRERFLDEPRVAASLDHASVIPIYEAGEHDGQLYLAMRYVPGSDLRTLLEREGAVEPDRALAILGQIAGALDAAHRQGLVHRDVKPANVLLDEDEHAYLTDFGITKQLSDDTSDTGHGTLDYLAPEQIRGEPVDGRTDGYALACMLYECLAGRPPFRRQTPAETMWAHLREDPPPLESHPALDPVLQRGLAQDRDDRYPTCAALIDAAHDVLAPRSPRVRMLVVAGLALIAVAIAGALLASRPGQEGAAAATAPEGNGVAAIEPDSEEIAEFVETAGAPSNVAVGDGAVWLLNADDGTIARIDPKTKAVTGHVESPLGATDIAAGAGAVWVGTGQGEGGNWTSMVNRIDPATNAITQMTNLPPEASGGDRFVINGGYPQMALGVGALWATGGGFVVRIDPESGKSVATVEADASRIAAGREGVWYISAFDAGAVTRINPRTNRTGRVIDVGDATLSGIAVGAGSVWVTAAREGVVFRIAPGGSAAITPIDVGTGVSYIAYGAGAVWAANYVDGTLSRIDPKTNAVVARTPIGAVQSLAAGAGSAWASTAGATRAGTLPASVCTDQSGGRKADVLIAADLPLQEDSPTPRAMADAIHAVLAEHDFRAGDYVVGYRVCDDSTAQAATYEARRCAANANAYAGADRLVALIAPTNSGCSQVELPILNRAPGGPLAVISPLNSDTGLTRVGVPPPQGNRGTPDIYYPIGTRHYVRVMSPNSLVGAAEAMLADQLGLEHVYVLHDGDLESKREIVDTFRQTARRLGVGIAGSTTFDPGRKRFDAEAIARRVERSGADGVLYAASTWSGSDLFRAVRERLGPHVPVMVPPEFGSHPTREVFATFGPGLRGVYVPTLDLPRTALSMTPAARRIARTIDAEQAGALEAAQATEILLDVIARSDGTRASVLSKLRTAKVTNGILGTFRFDDKGDMTPGWVAILRFTRPADSFAPWLEGAVVDRVERPVPSAGD